MFLGHSLDLLEGSETVLSVYERVEDANRESGGHASVHDVLADGMFARYLLLLPCNDGCLT